MVRTSLVESDIADGQRLVSALTESDRRFGTPHFLIKAAFWLFDQNSLDWRLIIATPLVDQRGPFSAYKDIQGVIRNLGKTTSLSLQDVSVVSPSDKTVRLIKKAASSSPGAMGQRIGRIRLDDIYVEDAYIYSLIDKAA